MTRRELFPSIAAAAVLPPFMPALADTPSPVRLKFEEWRRIFTWVNEGGLDDDEVEARMADLGRAERAVFSEPAQDAADVLWKIIVMRSYEYGLRADGTDAAGLNADLRHLLGADAEI